MTLDLPTFGFILIVVGIVLVIAGSVKDVKFAVVGFIGPLPIGFGNDPRLLQIALIAGAIIFILLILFLFRGFA